MLEKQRQATGISLTPLAPEKDTFGAWYGGIAQMGYAEERASGSGVTARLECP
jgi:hypothetical protein